MDFMITYPCVFVQPTPFLTAEIDLMPHYERFSAMLGATRTLETRLALCKLFSAMSHKNPELVEVADALTRLHTVQRRQDSLAVDIDAQLKVTSQTVCTRFDSADTPRTVA
jgi:hypothetical protein